MTTPHSKNYRSMPPSKLVRETFSMPASDVHLIDKIRDRNPALTARSTKSEIVRAGLHALCSMSDSDLEYTLTQIERLKTGRPVQKQQKS